MLKKNIVILILSSVVAFSGCSRGQIGNKNKNPTSQEDEEWIDVYTPTDGGSSQGGEDNPGDEGGEIIPVETPYEEAPDSLDGIDASDMSALYNAFSSLNYNYTITYNSYFNASAARIYYQTYKKNYIQDKKGIFTQNSSYLYPLLNEYLNVLNDGLLNYNSNLYKFSLKGATVEERLSSTLVLEDLSLLKENDTYQNNTFTLENLNENFLIDAGFTRISQNKYQTTNKDYLSYFMELTSPGMINDGFYMTFARATIELNVDETNAYRIRLYTPTTQIGKLIDSHRDQENKPNWYLLFSEALISNVGTTTFTPASSLLN